MAKSSNVTMGWILVQHSGWTVSGNPQFQNAVEMTLVTGEKKKEKLRAKGVMVYETYKAASDAEYAVNYPKEVRGLIPGADPKAFLAAKYEGQRLYAGKP